MAEIQIGKMLIDKRKEKGITQAELASYIGVSKAAVSKWETGQSYPDIIFLPQLAAYFNISVDQLLDYEPQMEKADIRKLYFKLAKDFTEAPFDQVFRAWEEVVKKYYSCFPLLIQMGILMLNHYQLEPDEQKQKGILEKVRGLFYRVKEESHELELGKKANTLQAHCELLLGNTGKVIELLKETRMPFLNDDPLLSSAYYVKGEIKKAKQTIQIGIYQHLLALCSEMTSYLLLYTDDETKYEEIVRRMLAVCEIFQMDPLYPGGTLGFYITAAQGYVMQEKKEQALAMLSRYTTVAIDYIFPLALHGDEFFDLLDDWCEELELGNAPPRDQKLIRRSVIEALTEHPAFKVLAEEPRYRSMAEQLAHGLEGG